VPRRDGRHDTGAIWRHDVPKTRIHRQPSAGHLQNLPRALSQLLSSGVCVCVRACVCVGLVPRTNTFFALLQEMATVKEFIEQYLPRIWPRHPHCDLSPRDTDLSPFAPPFSHRKQPWATPHPLLYFPHTHRQDVKHTHENHAHIR